MSRIRGGRGEGRKGSIPRVRTGEKDEGAATGECEMRGKGADRQGVSGNGRESFSPFQRREGEDSGIKRTGKAVR